MGAGASAVAGAATGGARAAGAASGAYSLGSVGRSGAGAVAGELGAVGQTAGAAATSPLRRAAEALRDNFRQGARSAVTSTGGTISGGATPSNDTGPAGPPAWAQAMRRRQTMTHGATVAAHTLRGGDGGGSGAAVDVSQKD